jgi:hypothetical protein
MEADLSMPVRRQTILSATRQICASRAICAAGLAGIFLIGSLTLGRHWMFATTCALAAVAAWEIYPRSSGIRYRTGLLTPDSVVREICLATFSRALHEETPIQYWNPEYFDLIRTPADGSRAEFSAASWIFTYALLNGDLATATRFIERSLALLPEDAPFTRYIGFGDALHFYTAVAPDESRSKLVVQELQRIDWGLRTREGYVEASIAFAKGHRAEALAIAEAELARIALKRGTAAIQLQRELLVRCRDKAS